MKGLGGEITETEDFADMQAVIAQNRAHSPLTLENRGKELVDFSVTSV
jgi:hypothetical protein